MNSINHTRPLPSTNVPTQLLHNDNLSPLVREAQATIPKNIVSEMAKMYGRQVNRCTASESSKVLQNKIDQSSKGRSRKDTSSLNKNITVHKTTFTDLPEDMRINICRFLDPATLKAVMSASKEMHETIESNTLLQNKILYDFALKMTLLIKKDWVQSVVLGDIAVCLAESNDVVGLKEVFDSLKEAVLLTQDVVMRCAILNSIATSLVKGGDMVGAKEIALLDDDFKSETLQCIAIAQAENNDMSGAKATVLLIEDPHWKFMALGDIAANLAGNGDMAGSKETLDLAKEIASQMKDDDDKFEILQNITVQLAKRGYMVDAEAAALLIDDTTWKSHALQAIAIEQVKNGDTIGARKNFDLAKEIASQMKDDDDQSEILQNIAVQLAKRGYMVDAEAAIFLIDDTTWKSNALQAIAIEQVKNGDTIGARKNFDLAKKTALLIEDTDSKSFILKDIVLGQATNGDIVDAEAAILLIDDTKWKSHALQAIAVEQVKNGDMIGARKNFDLAKKTALLIEDTDSKSRMLEKIAVEYAKSGDIVSAEATILLMGDTKWKFRVLQAIAIEQVKNGDIAGAEARALLIEETYWKSQALQGIVVEQIKNNNMAEARKTLGLSKEVALQIEDVSSRSKVLQGIAVNLVESGDIAGAKANIIDMKKMGDFASASQGALALIRVMGAKNR